MLDFIIKENNLMPILENNGMTEKDITFVKVKFKFIQYIATDD